jgi:hypothetical protein
VLTFFRRTHRRINGHIVLGQRHSEVPESWGLAGSGASGLLAALAHRGRGEHVWLLPLKRTQEIQQILLLLRRHLVEVIDHLIGLGTRARMRLNGRQQSTVG